MPTPYLDSIAKLRRAFYRLMNTDDGDDSLVEFDEDADEAVNLYLQQGLWDAQEYLISYVNPGLWLTVSGPIVTADWQGSDAVDGGRYVDLTTAAPRMLRISGDAKHSALHEAGGKPWGSLLVNDRERFSAGANAYYLMNDKLWVSKRSTIPATLYLHSHDRLPSIIDESTGADNDDAISTFPLPDRFLIVGFAADNAIDDAWPAGGNELYAKVQNRLEKAKKKAARRARRTRQPAQFKEGRSLGNHWMGGH